MGMLVYDKDCKMMTIIFVFLDQLLCGKTQYVLAEKRGRVLPSTVYNKPAGIRRLELPEGEVGYKGTVTHSHCCWVNFRHCNLGIYLTSFKISKLVQNGRTSKAVQIEFNFTQANTKYVQMGQLWGENNKEY